MFAALLANVIASAPALAQNTALLIGNSKYGLCSTTATTRCATLSDCPSGETCQPSNGNPLPGDFFDMVKKHSVFAGADWTVWEKPDKTEAEMKTEIGNLAGVNGKKLILWFSGHGAASTGNLVGVDGGEVDVTELLTALGTAKDRTLLKLDSCGSGKLAQDADLAAGTEPNGLGYITATTGAGTCPAGSGTGSAFTLCFFAGLRGSDPPADQAPYP